MTTLLNELIETGDVIEVKEKSRELPVVLDAQHVADPHRPDEGHAVDRDGDHPPAGAFSAGDAAGEIHLGKNPAAEDVARGIRVARHGHGAQRQFAFRGLIVDVLAHSIFSIVVRVRAERTGGERTCTDAATRETGGSHR